MSEQQPPSDPNSPPYGAPQPAYGQPPGETHTPATISLILGVLSLVCLGFLSGIPAMILGRKASKEIAASQGRLGGGGLATAGFVTGLIGTILSIIGLILFVVLVVIGNEAVDQLEENCRTIATDPTDC